MSTAAVPGNANTQPLPDRGNHHRKLEKLRQLEKLRRTLFAGLIALAILIGLALLIGIIDFRYELTTGQRMMAWGAIAITAILGGWSMRRWLKFESVDAVVAAEQARPELGQRLRTSHDYQTDPENVSPAHPDLLQTLESETEERVASQQIDSLGPRWPVALVAGVCLAAGVIWLAFFVAEPQWRVTTARLMLLPAQYSSVELEPIPEQIHQGSDLAIELRVDGRPVETARVLYRTADQKQWESKALKPSESGPLINELTATLTDRQRDLEVKVEAGHFHSEVFPIRVQVPLILEEWTVKVVPPKYTGLAESEGSPEELQIPEGSRVLLTARYSRPAESVKIDFSSKRRIYPPSKIDEETATFSFEVDGESLQVYLDASSPDGMTDKSSVYLAVVPDQRPRLKLDAPEAEAEAIPTAELTFSPTAMDDHGLKTIGIRYRIDDGDEQTLWETSLDEPSDAVRHSVQLPLEDLNVAYPQAITYYAYATDNREPQPNEVTSELRFVDIRPFSREYQFKKSNGGNCQGECLSLEKLIKEQREILGRTFAAANQTPPPSQAGERLAKQEEQLRSKTASLADALTLKVGPMPTLESAVENMASAIEELEKEAIEEGQHEEQSALADLIATRQNLRKILKMSNSQSQACRQVDQQQMDKIRKPEQKKQDASQATQEKKLADIREQLQRLANQQESFCQSAKSCSSPSSSSSSSSKSSSGSRSQDNPEAKPTSLPSREELVSQQKDAASQTRELEEKLADGQFGSLAEERTKEAADAIENSGELLAQEDADERAISEAREAAETLRQLANHLGRRHAPDFEDKLAAAKRQAEQIADQQKTLSQSLAKKNPGRNNKSESDRGGEGNGADKPDPASEQGQLADRAEELADLVDQMVAESTEQEWEIQEELARQSSSHSPRQAASTMQRAEKELEQGRTQPAANSGNSAADTLRRFAAGLESVQQALGPAQLEQLTKAERETAARLKEVKRVQNPAEQAMAEARSRELAESISSLARRDPELARATESLRRLAGGATTAARSQDAKDPEETGDPRHAAPPTTLADGLRDVGAVLQQRIQEAILSGAMQQSDGAVPPDYTEMVDEYYRVLSEDVE